MLLDIFGLVQQYFDDQSGMRPPMSHLDFSGIMKEVKTSSGYRYTLAQEGLDSEGFLLSFIRFYMFFSTNKIDAWSAFNTVIDNIRLTDKKLKDPAISFIADQTVYNFNEGFLF